jgi:hypothetical protein
LADLSAAEVTDVEVVSDARTEVVVDAAPRRRTSPLVLLLMLALGAVAFGSLVDLPFGAAHEVGESGDAVTTAPQTDAPESSSPGANPDEITSVGYGPFRIGADTAPLIAAKRARTPINSFNCDPSGLLVSSDPRYGSTYAFKDGDRVDFVAVLDSTHATDDGLRVGMPMDKVTSAADDVRTFEPPDSLRYLIPKGRNGILFIDDGEGRVGLIVVGPVERLVSIGNETLRPELCGV